MIHDKVVTTAKRESNFRDDIIRRMSPGLSRVRITTKPKKKKQTTQTNILMRKYYTNTRIHTAGAVLGILHGNVTRLLFNRYEISILLHHFNYASESTIIRT